MAAFFDGLIHSVPDTILEDIEVVVDYATTSDEGHVANAAARLEAYVRNYRLKSSEDEAKSNIVDNLTPAQEAILKEEHAKDYHGTDDDMSDAFDGWLEDRTSDELKQLLNL